MVALGIDVLGEVEQVLDGAGDLPGPTSSGSRLITWNTAQASSDESDRRREDAELRLLELAARRTRGSRSEPRR